MSNSNNKMERQLEYNKDCWFIDVCENANDPTKCNQNCMEFLYLKWQMEYSLLPKAKHKSIKMYLDDFNKEDKDAYKRLDEIRHSIRDFVNEGQNLYICGTNMGNGKTSWAIRMLHTYLYHVCYGEVENPVGFFISVPKLLTNAKNFDSAISKKYIENIRKHIDKVGLVVWDDLAISGCTPYDYLQLYDFINERVFAEKSNIFTSNVVEYDVLEEMIGQRLASRTYNMSEIIELKGKDRR